ncbi:MAG TPA: tetratricopeptide repeat protein [Candidatus Coatesbacteria bacterium]|nr:tetratricopeptide repeat protein [Candidatus Coatesbacteria bacterium]
MTRLFLPVLVILAASANALEVREVPPLVKSDRALAAELERGCWELIYVLDGGGSAGEVSARLSRLTDGYSERLRSGSYAYQLLLGRLAYAVGDLERARETMMRASGLNPAAAEPLAWVAVVELKRGRLEAALSAANTALELDPLQPVAREVARGVLVLLSDSAGTFSSKEPEAVEELLAGDRSFSRGEYGEAALAYGRALELDPAFVEARLYLGDCRYRTGDYAGALVEYRRAVELNPEFAPAWSFMGDALAALERTDEAVEAYRRALELDPDYAGPRAKLRQLGVAP